MPGSDVPGFARAYPGLPADAPAPTRRTRQSARPAPFQQYQHGARSAGMVRRFAVGEYLITLREPQPYFSLEHRLAIGRGESLAVDDAHATPAGAARRIEELGQRLSGFIARMAVKTELPL